MNRKEEENRQEDIVQPIEEEERVEISNRATAPSDADEAIRQLRAEIAQRDAQIDQVRSEGQAKQALIDLLDAQIEARGRLAQQLDAKHDQILAERQARRQLLDHNDSVKKLLETHGGLPQMETNTAVGFKSNATSRHEDECKQGGAERDKKIAKIAIPKNVADFLEHFEVNFRGADGFLIKSVIAIKMGFEDSKNKEAKLPNFNERSVYLHVSDLLFDVLNCLGLSLHTVSQEISMFSMQPDIMVVRWNTSIILVVEVNSPGMDGRAIVSNCVATSRAYTNAVALRHMGIDHPFVCLSTYDYMRIGTMRRCSEEIMEDTANRLKDGPIPEKSFDSEPSKQTPTSPAQTETMTSVIPGANSLHSNLDDGHEAIWDEESDTTFSENHGRLYFSETFTRKNIFKALYFTVACGIVAAQKSTNDQQQQNDDDDPIPSEGLQIDRCVPVVGAKSSSLQWETLKCKATYQLKCQWQSNMKVYLHCLLDQGCSGKVFLGSNSTGHMFVVKFFLYDSQTMSFLRRRAAATAANNNAEPKKSNKELAMGIRDDEAKKWKVLYPCYAKSVYELELFGVPCLTMPYVTAIPINRRKDLLKQIENELTRFSNAGYMYFSNCKRQWYHIGLRNDNNVESIVLIDLDSLIETPKAKDVAHVKSAISALEDGSEDEPIYAELEMIHS